MTEVTYKPVPEQHITLLRELVIEKYGLVQRSGRIEEFEFPGTTRAISISYGCGSVRVRLMNGREWVGHPIDNSVGDYRWDELLTVLDAWFIATSQRTRASLIQPEASQFSIGSHP